MKQYDKPNEVLASGEPPVTRADVDVRTAAEDLYSRVGARFPVTWYPQSPDRPVVHTGDLPASVSESDVETALNNMKADGVL